MDKKSDMEAVLEEQRIIIKTLEKEITGMKLLINTVGALIDTLVEKGIVTKEEVSAKLKK